MKASSQPILALDIGTRKVAGLVVEPHGRSLRVLAACVLEHPDRAMLDGQVHKIEAVARVVSEIKARLEAATGLTLTSAAVAAAGRALLTESAEQKRTFLHPTEITREEVLGLELSAAQTALANLQNHGSKSHLHCVGFSAVRYFLDGEPLDDLIGHQGREIGVQVLATFLPRQVVDALLGVLRRSGLSGLSLTLEPIAAIEATIPPDLRRMNIALVDVGAGTSDIAITREGSVFAYAMVTQAGDEITERLCEQYLLEFGEAERLKRLAEKSGEKPIIASTILGQKLELTPEEIIRVILPDVRELAQAIAKTILKLNSKPPRAVIMVGGGSRTPRLGEEVAAALEIEPGRVGCRGPETIQDLENPTDCLKGIEGITPLGIGLLALKQQGLKFIAAHLNGQMVQMLSLTSQPTVFEALLSAGRDIRQLYARPGVAISYTLEGELMTCPGTLGCKAEIKVNGKSATLDTIVPEAGRIEIVEAIPGEDARLSPASIPKPPGPHWCTINGKNHELNLVLMNHREPLPLDLPVPDRAELTWCSDKTIAELVEDLKIMLASASPFSVQINGETKVLNQGHSVRLLANGQEVPMEYRPGANDRVEWTNSSRPQVRLKELVEDLPEARRIKVMVNGKPKTLDVGGCRILVNGAPATSEDIVVENAEIVIEKKKDATPILSQVLVDFEMKPPKDAGPLQLTVDGRKAAFTTPLHDGSRVEISFGS